MLVRSACSLGVSCVTSIGSMLLGGGGERETVDSRLVRGSAFAPTVRALQPLQQPQLLAVAVGRMEAFLTLYHNGAAGRRAPGDQFVLNRQASDILEAVRRLLAEAKRAASMDVVAAAVYFERDDYGVLRSVCDDYVKNMLLA